MGKKIDLNDLIDAKAIADILNLSHREAVSLYQKRYVDMPRPVLDLGKGRPRLWLKSEINRWIKQRVKLTS